MISKSQIKHINSLHIKKHRELAECFIAEGVKTVLEIIEQQPNIIKELFGTHEFLNAHEKIIKSKAVDFTLITEKELLQISALTNPNQTIAVCHIIKPNTITFNFDTRFSFYLDDIRDPGNLGTIIRICSWFGITDLFCSPTTVELYNPKCIQSTMGSFLRVNVHYINLTDLLSICTIKNIYTTELKGKSIYTQNLKSGLVIIGNEANGINDKIKTLATTQLTIPSASGNTESLNAAIATSIIASEFYRNTL